MLEKGLVGRLLYIGLKEGHLRLHVHDLKDNMIKWISNLDFPPVFE